MSWAQVGIRCVCIRWVSGDDYTSRMFNIAPLSVDAVYTIREVVQRPGGHALLLREITNVVGELFDFEMAYAIERFRPLVTATGTEAADIALIKSLTNPARQGETV